MQDLVKALTFVVQGIRPVGFIRVSEGKTTLLYKKDGFDEDFLAFIDFEVKLVVG